MMSCRADRLEHGFVGGLALFVERHAVAVCQRKGVESLCEPGHAVPAGVGLRNPGGTRRWLFARWRVTLAKSLLVANLARQRPVHVLVAEHPKEQRAEKRQEQ